MAQMGKGDDREQRGGLVITTTSQCRVWSTRVRLWMDRLVRALTCIADGPSEDVNTVGYVTV